MLLKSKDIIKDLGISREAFYKNNRTGMFKRVSRGTYEIEEGQYQLLCKYYALKSWVKIWGNNQSGVPKEK